jgi:hypothetical protein
MYGCKHSTVHATALPLPHRSLRRGFQAIARSITRLEAHPDWKLLLSQTAQLRVNSSFIQHVTMLHAPPS